MIKRFLLILWLALAINITRAQEPIITEAPQEETFDTTVYEDQYDEVISEDKYGEETVVYNDSVLNSYEMIRDTVESWKKDPEFSYMKNLDSLLREHQKLATANSKPRPAGFWGKIFNNVFLERLFWILGAVAVLYILSRLVAENGLFAKRNRKNKVEEITTEDEKVMQVDFDREIAKAEQAGDFRSAVRYRFLQKLKLLNDRQSIKFAIDKTNSVYAREMDAGLRPAFLKIARHYENVWYGHRIPDERSYNNIKSDYNSISF